MSDLCVVLPNWKNENCFWAASKKHARVPTWGLNSFTVPPTNITHLCAEEARFDWFVTYKHVPFLPCLHFRFATTAVFLVKLLRVVAVWKQWPSHSRLPIVLVQMRVVNHPDSMSGWPAVSPLFEKGVLKETFVMNKTIQFGGQHFLRRSKPKIPTFLILVNSQRQSEKKGFALQSMYARRVQ